jgi:hypothetical protein
MGLVDVQGGEGHATPCPEPAEHRGIESLNGNVSRCHVTRASSFLSVIIISLTWHMLQVSSPYQPRLFSPALGVLSSCVRPLLSTSKRYARGRASPSPTDGRSPAIQLPLLLLSSCHCRCCLAAIIVVVQLPLSLLSGRHHRCCPAAIVVIVQPPLLSLSSCHCCCCPAAIVIIVQPPLSLSSCHHCHPSSSGPCRLARIRGTCCPMSRTCLVSRDMTPQWWTSVDAAYCVHRFSPKWFNRTTYPFTCSKRVFMHIKAVLISLGSPSHWRRPLLVDVECRFGV